VTKFSFQYTVLQHHPGQRGECVNFGVRVKHIQTGRVLTKITKDLSRLVAIDPNFNGEAHRIFFPAGVHELQEAPGPLVVHNGSMAEAMSSTQFTTVRGGIGSHFHENSIEGTLDWAFDFFVAPIPARR
jgi:hypothetical protein